MLSKQKKKEIRAYLNARATWEMDNVPYINLTPKLKGNTDNLIWLTSDVEEFLFDLVDTFGGRSNV